MGELQKGTLPLPPVTLPNLGTNLQKPTDF